MLVLLFNDFVPFTLKPVDLAAQVPPFILCLTICFSIQKENYFYYDHRINRNPITPGSIVKLIPNNQLYYVILAYDKLVEFVKTLPFGEEWMIRNTIIPPSEDDKKGKK